MTANPFYPNNNTQIGNESIINQNQPTVIPRQYNAISPKALSNQNTIASVFGQANQGTFTRSVGASPLMQTIDPLTGQNIDPTMEQSASMPVLPPNGVQTPITPTYDLNNQ